MAQNENNNFYTMVVVALCFGAAWLAWYMAAGTITSAMRWVRIGEMNLLALFTHEFDNLLRVLPEMKVAPHAEKLGPQYLDWPTFWNISAKVGDYMRWPAAILMGFFLFRIQYRAPTSRYKNKYDLEGMMQIQSRTWPVIAPMLNFNPTKVSTRIPGEAVPVDLPPFAESLSPDEWVAWARIPLREGVPDEEGVRQALTQQLGPRWEKMVGLKPYHRALIAAFGLKGLQRRTESDDLLGQVAQCWTVQHGLVLTEVVEKKINDYLADKKLASAVFQAAEQHAYRTTALLGILAWARQQGGVLAPAQFLWLRGEDRGLWYPLNNLGRRSYHAEAAGAMAHYMAENIAGRALLMPRVKTAIQPVIDYVRENGGRVPDITTKTNKAALKPANAK